MKFFLNRYKHTKNSIIFYVRLLIRLIHFLGYSLHLEDKSRYSHFIVNIVVRFNYMSYFCSEITKDCEYERNRKHY